MAQNTTVALTANTWTQLTDGNVTAMRALNLGTDSIWVQATVGAVAPSNTNGAVSLAPGKVEILTLATMWPGVAGANRIYALSPVAGRVSVSNA